MTVVFLRPKSLSPQWGMQQPDLGLAYCVSYLKQHDFEIRYYDRVEANRSPQVPDDAWVVISSSDYTMNNDGSPTIAEARSILAATGRADGRKSVFVGPYSRQALKTVPRAVAIDRESDPERPLHRVVSGEDLDQIHGIWRSYEQFQPPGDLLENLDILPFPDWEAMSAAYPKSATYEFNITNRGCPFNCSFCYHWRGKKVRYRSVANVIEQLLKQQDRGATFIDFKDDTFTVSIRYTMELCSAMLEKGFRLPWRCHTRPDMVNLELFKAMKAAGCDSVGLGVESFSQDILDAMDKDLDVKSVLDSFHLAKQARIKTFAYIVFGFSGETEETMRETLNNVLQINPDYVQFAFATPFPGTPYYQTMKQRGFQEADDLSDFNVLRNAPVGSERMTPEEILNFGKFAKKKFIQQRIQMELSQALRLKQPLRRLRSIRRYYRAMRSPVSWVI
jgi:radical SAM superfamily enzyme YgiQ (UPF0313 family)